jgi:hypothetical protein
MAPMVHLALRVQLGRKVLPEQTAVLPLLVAHLTDKPSSELGLVILTSQFQ